MSKFYLRSPEPPILSSEQIVEIADDGSIAFIPIAETNADYQKYLTWLAEGNAPEPWNPEEIK